MKSEDSNINAGGDQIRNNILLLKSAHIFNHDEIIEGDIMIGDGIIRNISKNISLEGEHIRVIDCEGKYVIPGGVDINTRFLGKSNNIPCFDDFYSGTAAALTGGTTTIINEVETDDSCTSLIKKVNEIREKADSQVCCDYGLHVGLKTFNEKVAQEMKILIKDFGINSFKIDLRDENCDFHDDRNVYDLLKFSKKLGIIMLINALNGRLMQRKASDVYNSGISGPEGHRYSSSEELEIDSIHHIITLSNETNSPVIFTNVMSPGAAKLIANSKSKGSIIYGEILAASLTAEGIQNCEKSWDHAAAFVTDPPLSKDIYTGQKLIQHLANGGMDFISSNHCKFTIKKKQNGIDDFRKIPSGITGVNERMMVAWDKGVNVGVFDGCQFVAATSANAAQILNIYPKKGAIKVGSDADIVIWDPKALQQLKSDDNQNKNWINIFDNFNCHGGPDIVLSNGRIVYENKALIIKPGSGKFLKLQPNPQHVYKRVALKDKLLTQSMKPIIRYPLEMNTNDTALNTNNVSNETNKDNGPKVMKRAVTRCGGRNMQESTFSLSGSQVDDNKPVRSSIRAQQPPGGVSSYPW